jgi:transcriptional regulator with XRE-family HTH domain
MTLLAAKRSDAEAARGSWPVVAAGEQRQRRRHCRRATYDTRFDRFLGQEGITLEHLAAAVGIRRETLRLIRAGKHEPRQSTIAGLVLALRQMTGERIYASDPFYLGEEEDDRTPEAKPFVDRRRPRATSTCYHRCYQKYPARVPQHRERVFIVGFDKDTFGDHVHFDFSRVQRGTSPKLKDILEEKPDPKYTLTSHLWKYLQQYAERHKERGNGFGFGIADPESVTRTLSAR